MWADTRVVRVCCLPLAGKENPYQHLMMNGLRSSDLLEVTHGRKGRVFAAIRTAITCRPDFIHYDWIHSYFLRRYRFLSWVHAPVFILEVLFVRYILNVRVVWTMHNLVTHDTGSSVLELWVRRRFARVCEWIRVFDESTVERAASLLQVNSERFQIVPEGSYVNYYPDTIAREEARRRLDISNDAVVLLYLGQIRPYKGLEELIDAYAAVREAHWELVLAGFPLDKGYARLVAEKAQRVERVRVHLDHVDDDDLQVYFKAADVVVLPYQKVENSGTAVLAMGFGRAIVAPMLGVLPNRLRQQAGLLYEPGSLHKALGALKDVDRQELHALGLRNRQAVTSYSWRDFGHLFNSQFRNGLRTAPDSDLHRSSELRDEGKVPARSASKYA